MTTKTGKLHYEAVLQKLLASSDLPALADLVGGVGTNMPGTPSEMRDEGEARVQTAHRKPTLTPNLAKAYRSYWTLAESEPLDVFHRQPTGRSPSVRPRLPLTWPGRPSGRRPRPFMWRLAAVPSAERWESCTCQRNRWPWS